ncbi:hypothetical protein SERLA73DRAFT_175735 [Serpula lacrymans var. lacrymans S7.3]|uniref:Uncharacterized protein n=1 Tax=Serpula lacrymans var. lacrymans (strain S7.3) TaxID=936435 RepID=F8PLA2_SERL3|nr:hypothetical protein SERLA73DRAFT_175735 [Serpula lacrymans var. lacrymans S7.3]
MYSLRRLFRSANAFHDGPRCHHPRPRMPPPLLVDPAIAFVQVLIFLGDSNGPARISDSSTTSTASLNFKQLTQLPLYSF